MTIYARIDGQTVAELISTDLDITTLHHPDIMWAEVSEVVPETGWLYQDGVFSPPISAARTKASLLTEVAAKRWQMETGGIIISGHPIATDRESQSQLNSAYTSLKNELITDTPWKAADGTFTLVTLTEIEPVAQAVAAHVRACFAAEQAHAEAIDALQTQAELDAYDIATGWPE